jgi:uroporphyrin-III C-methyltransferase
MTDASIRPAGPGTVHLVGAGPGAADLLTVRAVRLLARADIVFHDALVDDEVLALAPQARHVAVGKRCGRLHTAQRFINRQLVEAARRHAVVVRLKGGDPLVFGRAQEEIDALLAAGIPVRVVPGVTAACAAGAELIRSLTVRGTARSVLLLTPRVGEGEPDHPWARAAAAADTVALYMASRDTAAVAAALIEAGVPHTRPAVLVENASRPGARLLHAPLHAIGEAAAALGTGPALLLVGEPFAPAPCQAATAAAPAQAPVVRRRATA